MRKVIGYCPQQDALLDKLTGRETMKMFCTLRGIPTDEHELVILQLSQRLVFYKFLDVEVGRYRYTIRPYMCNLFLLFFFSFNWEI